MGIGEDKDVSRAYMIVQLVYEGLCPVLLLVALPCPGKRPSHAVVDHNIELVPLQQRRACTTLSISMQKKLPKQSCSFQNCSHD